MLKKLLLIFCLTLAAVSADPQHLYRGTLSPLERVTLRLEDDGRFSFELSDDKSSSKAVGNYRWKGNQLNLEVQEVKFSDPAKRHPATGFEIQIRRKGVDTPPPSVWFAPGQLLILEAYPEKDRLRLEGPDGWSLTLFSQS